MEGQEGVSQKEVLEGLHCHCSSARKGEKQEKQKNKAPCSQKPRGPNAFHTAQSLLILLPEEIPGCSFSLGVFIIKSLTEDKKTWLLKWCNFSFWILEDNSY